MKLQDCYKQGLLKKIKPDPENAERSIMQARKNIDDAVKNLEIECYNVVIILCYTSMFHTARALLFKDRVKERSHLCIPIYLKSKYPELVKLANTLDAYRMFRHRTIYAIEITIDKYEAEEAIEAAEEFVDKIDDMI